MTQTKTTFHRDGTGKLTRVTNERYQDGSSKTTVSRGSKDLFGIFSGRITSQTRTDKSGNSWTKKR